MTMASGPLAQADLDSKLQHGDPILMLVGDTFAHHAVTVGGCGNGKYYFHDPEWIAGRYEEYTYSQLLEYQPLYKWLDTLHASAASEAVVV